jgi:DNA polymerase
MNAHPDLPAVAFVFGGSAAQKITGERDALPQLRETVLAINSDGLEEIPVVASFDLLHLLSKPKDKALLWQDLLLAKSVLQSL